MLLQTRLTITTTAIITAVSAAVGIGAISSSYQNELNRLDGQLNSVASQIVEAKGEELSAALLLGTSIGDDLSIALFDINGNTSSLQDGRVDLELGLSNQLMLSAKNKPVEVQGELDYRLRSVQLSDGELVLLALPMAEANQTRDANLNALVWYVLLADLIAALGLWFLIRKDLAGIRSLARQADLVSQGKLEHLKIEANSSEVASLGNSLARMVDQLQDSRRTMQQFLGDASHELRTPLTTLRGYLDLLAKPGQSENRELVNKALPIMSSEANRMQQLINDLLLLAELGEGSVNTDFSECVDLETLVAIQFSPLPDLDSTRKLELSLQTCNVRGNRALLERLLANLVSNQLRHTPPTTTTRVTLEQTGDVVALTVDDSGPGLHPEIYQRGANHFERFDKSRSQASGGSGLGMSICSQIVQNHGGSLLLSPSELGGLRTQIKLPAA